MNSIDIKTVFLQGKERERTVYVKPPKEARTDKLWLLRKCVYSLADAPRCWYLRVREELSHLHCNASKLDNGLFSIKNGCLCGIIVCFVNDLLCGGTEEFSVSVIGKIHKVFTVGSECTNSFTYVGVEAHQNDGRTITINQNSFAASIQPIEVTTKGRSLNKAASLTDDERTKLRSTLGQLNWLAGISRNKL